MTDTSTQLSMLVMLATIAQVACDCRLGILTSAAGAAWAITDQQQVYSIVPQFVPPSDKTVKAQSLTRVSEAQLIVEARPPLPPSTKARLCIRSLAPTAAACSGRKPAAAPDAPQATDTASLLFNATEGVPLGPCMELSADGTAASRKIEKPHPPDCWPGSQYCTDHSTSWHLFTNKTKSGQQQFTLRITRERSTYQDTDGSSLTWVAELPLTLTAGCALKVSAGVAAADASTTFCTSCTSNGAKLSSISTSSSCMRCPARSSKAKEALAAVGAPWSCIPGMPKQFETVPVRMGLGGNPECASLDGRTCLRGLPNAATCQAMLPLLNRASSGPAVVLRPLTCGAAHATKWPGVTGYTTPGHWCIVAREWFQDLQPTVLGRCVMKP